MAEITIDFDPSDAEKPIDKFYKYLGVDTDKFRQKLKGS